MAASNCIKLLLLAALLSGCGSVTAIVGQHVSNPTVSGPMTFGSDPCEVTADYLGVGRGMSWRHNRGNTRIYGTVGIKDTRQCATVDADTRDISPGAQLLVIREFDRRK
jgi:hypothetical protein